MAANARGQHYIISGIVLSVLATIFVALRFASRWMSGVNLGLDDALIVLALLLAYSMLGEGVIWARDGGLGKPFLELSPGEQEIFWKCFLANQFSYTFICPTIKISILLFYRRVFQTSRRFSIASIMVGPIVFMWCVAVFFTVLFQCKPIAFNWDKTIPGGTCINPQTFFWGNSISNLLTDVIILGLPIPMIWRLNMSKGRKIAVTGIFLLGGFVCIASIMRIVTLGLIENSDIPHSLVTPAMWTEVEPCVGIICACLPILRPLFKEGLSSLSSKYAQYTSSRFPSRQSQSDKDRNTQETRPCGVVSDEDGGKRYSHYMDQGAPSPFVRAGPAIPPPSQTRTRTSEEYPRTDISSTDRNGYKV